MGTWVNISSFDFCQFLPLFWMCFCILPLQKHLKQTNKQVMPFTWPIISYFKGCETIFLTKNYMWKSASPLPATWLSRWFFILFYFSFSYFSFPLPSCLSVFFQYISSQKKMTTLVTKESIAVPTWSYVFLLFLDF